MTMRCSALRLAGLALVLVGCNRGEDRSAASPDIPYPVGFPDTPRDTQDQCEPGPEPAVAELFPDRIDLAPGESASVEVYVTRNGYCGPIEVIIPSLPEGVSSDASGASWPADVATVQLIAGSELSDEIRIATAHAWIGYEVLREFDLRTRKAAEPNWTDEVVGIPDTQTMIDPIRLGANRIVFSDYERTVPGAVTPFIRCIELGVGRCADFGESGSVALESGPGWMRLARAPDGSVIVAVRSPDSPDSTRRTTWHRLTHAGDLLPLPALAPVATDSIVAYVAVDPHGRILFLSVPNVESNARTLVRLEPDGSLDESFGDGGSVPAPGVIGIHLIPDGRIVLGGLSEFRWLEEDGTPIGSPVFLHVGAIPAATLPDGAMIYGEITPEHEPDETGYVTIVEPDGTVRQRWELGLGLQPHAFFLGGEEPLVIAVPVYGWGDVRVMRLPLDGEPVVIAERRVGTSAWPRRVIDDSGSLFVLGSRAFRLPDGAVPWEEAFVWRVE